MAKKEIVVKKKILFKYEEIKNLSVKDFQEKLKQRIKENRKKL